MIELASILILGILAQWFAWKTKLPAILPLIIIGLIVGPISTYFTEDGLKWIEPMFNEEFQNGIFPNDILFNFVSLSIGIILFEGGLTLKKKEIKNVGPVIIKLISIGSLITFILGALAAHFLMNLDWSISFLFSGLIIVTGPTVISPILRNIPLKKDLAAILKWEGILIDPIGALVAVLVFEFISSGGNDFTSHAFQAFGMILLIGIGLGFTSAYALYYLLKKKLVPHYLLNVFTLALVLGVFVASDSLAHESGLLAVVIMGMVLGNLDVKEMKGILDFKESLSVLLISLLFILLSANIDIKNLELLVNWRVGVLFLFVILIIRPLAVFASSFNSDLTINEKLFISWVGPRGIVAAGIASLFGLKLTARGVPGAELITPLVFMIVLGTVLFNAATARLVAKKLNVLLEVSSGILFIGANQAARLLAVYLKQNNRHVVLIDNNISNVERAKSLGLNSFRADVYTDDLVDDIELNDIGFMLAMTGSSEVNTYAAERFGKDLGENGTYKIVSAEERANPEKVKENSLFSAQDDYIRLIEVSRDYPQLHEYPVNNEEEYLAAIAMIKNEQKSIPVFFRSSDNSFEVITARNNITSFHEGSKIVYMGQEITNN